MQINKQEFDLIVKGLTDRPIVQHIQKELHNQKFHPDITGYVAFLLVPPDLSGYSSTTNKVDDPTAIIEKVCRKTPFLSLDFTPPEPVINVGEVTGGASIKIPYAASKQAGGQLTISYLEDSNLSISTLHNIWIHYIYDVIYGYVNPDSKYIHGDEKYSIDYATSAFIIKYSPTADGEIYIGKASGLFPTSVPTKELLGTRSENQNTMLSCNYICADYDETTVRL